MRASVFGATNRFVCVNVKSSEKTTMATCEVSRIGLLPAVHTLTPTHLDSSSHPNQTELRNQLQFPSFCYVFLVRDETTQIQPKKRRFLHFPLFDFSPQPTRRNISVVFLFTSESPVVASSAPFTLARWNNHSSESYPNKTFATVSIFFSSSQNKEGCSWTMRKEISYERGAIQRIGLFVQWHENGETVHGHSQRNDRKNNKKISHLASAANAMEEDDPNLNVFPVLSRFVVLWKQGFRVWHIAPRAILTIYNSTQHASHLVSEQMYATIQSKSNHSTNPTNPLTLTWSWGQCSSSHHNAMGWSTRSELRIHLTRLHTTPTATFKQTKSWWPHCNNI